MSNPQLCDSNNRRTTCCCTVWVQGSAEDVERMFTHWYSLQRFWPRILQSPMLRGPPVNTCMFKAFVCAVGFSHGLVPSFDSNLDVGNLVLEKEQCVEDAQQKKDKDHSSSCINIGRWKQYDIPSTKTNKIIWARDQTIENKMSEHP